MLWILIGSPAVAAGLLLNPWAIAAWFSPDGTLRPIL